MAAVAPGEELERTCWTAAATTTTATRGSWPDVQDSLFLERLDSPDRSAPTAPAALVVSDTRPASSRFSWRASSDDVGPVAYRVYEDGRFVGR